MPQQKIKKRHETAVNRAEPDPALLHEMLRASKDALLLVNRDHVIRFANEALGTLCPRSPETIVGLPFQQAFSEDEAFATHWTRRLHLAFQEGLPFRERSSCHFGQETRHYEAHLTPVQNGESRVEHAVLQFRDMTPTARLEENLARLSDELQEKKREIEQLLFVSSHDLRSPLINIQGFSSELELAIQELGAIWLDGYDPSQKATVEKLLNENILEALQYIKASTAKIDSLLTGLLKLSRVGRSSVLRIPLNMNRLIHQVSEALRYQLRKRELNLIVEELPPCQGDPTTINQLFTNLLDNAIKYQRVPSGGNITIGGRREGEWSLYWVKDDGIGIPGEYRETVFELFHRLDPELTPGDGLGLAIVKRIVMQHEGRIRLESEPGKGSTFFVHLPHAALHARSSTDGNSP